MPTAATYGKMPAAKYEARSDSALYGEIAVKIYALLEQLEQLANDSRKGRLRFGNRIMVDEDELLDLIDQMRATIPEEIRQSNKMLTERERILTTAQSEAERLRQQAEADATRMVDEEKLLAEARERADAILTEANETAAVVRKGADEYAAEVLRSLEQMLGSAIGHIRNGLSELEKDRRP